MRNNYQSKAVPRGTRTIWRYFSALFLFFALGITQMWGADPDLSVVFGTGSGTPTYGDYINKSYTVTTGISVSINQYVASGNAGSSWNGTNSNYGYVGCSSSANTFDQHNIRISASGATIDSVAFLITSNGSTAANPAIGAWSGDFAAGNAQFIAALGTLSTTNSYAGASWTKIDVSDVGAVIVGITRKVSTAMKVNNTAISAQVGNGQNFRVFGVKVWLHPSETPASGNAITTSATNGEITTKVGGSAVTSAEKDATVDIEAIPATGYGFTSWDVYKTGDSETKVSLNADDDSNNKTRAFTMPAYAVTVGATFTAINYTVTHNAATNGTYTIKVGDAEAVSENTTAHYNQTVTLTATPAEGYELSGWTVMNGETPVEVTNNQFTMPAASVTVSATFAEAAPIVCPESGVVFSMAMNQVTDATKKTLTANEQVNLGESYAVVSGGTATLTNTGSAKGKIDKANPGLINFDGNAAYLILDLDCPIKTGDRISIVNTTSVEMAFTASATLDATYKTTTTDGIGVFTVPAALNNVDKLYCWRATGNGLKFSAVTITRPYNISFSSAKGTAPEATKGIEIELAQITGVDGWVHSGWTADKNVKVGGETKTAGTALAVNAEVELTDNTTFTATWEEFVVKHTVTYYDGATELGTELVNEGSNPTATGIVAPHKLGYTFDGWSTTNGGAAVALNTISVAADMPLYAVYSEINCAALSGTIFSLVMDNAPTADVTIRSGSGYNTEADLSQYATISGGIATAKNSSTSNHVIITTTPVVRLAGSNGKIFIQFDCALKEGDKIKTTINSQNIAYTIADSRSTTNYFTKGTDKELTITKGHALENATEIYLWSASTSGGELVSLQVIRPESFEVTFNMHGHGEGINPRLVIDGGKVPDPGTPAAEGWTFGGWYKEDTYDNAWDFANDVVTADTELHAKWTAWPTMTLNRGAATSGDDVVTSVEPGSVVAVPACPFTYTDYNFDGWEYSPAVTMVDETHFTMPSENLTLTAQWVDANNVAQIGEVKYATFAEAAAAVADGETIQLLQDCDYDATWTITGMAVTLDLNGKNLTGPASGDAVAITTDGVLTIMDGTATVDPTINGSNEITYAAGKFSAGKWLINVYDGGAFVMNSGWLLAGEAAVYVEKTGVVTVNNGVLEAQDNAVIMGHGSNGKGGYTINVHGGILLGHIQSANYASMCIYHPNLGTLNIDGGTLISTNGPAVVVRGGESNITGGTIIAQGEGTGKCGDASQNLGAVGIAVDFNSAYPGVASTNVAISGDANVSGAAEAVQAIYAGATPTVAEENAVAISGGSFNTPVAEALCADDYYPATKPSGKYGVTVAALSVNFVEEAEKTEGQKAWTTFLTDNHYDYNLGDGGEISWDKANAYDTGLKLKKSTNNAIYFTTEPGKLIELTVGNIAGMTIQINGGEPQTITSGTNIDNLGVSSYYSDNAQAVVLKETSGSSGYNMLKSINIHDPYQVAFNANGGDLVAPQYATPSVTLPSALNGTKSLVGWFDAAIGGTKVGDEGDAFTPMKDTTLFAQWEDISTDARLASITLDPSTGVLSPAFDPEVTVYTYTMPYGTAAIPQITGATAVNAGGSYNIVSQADAWGETAIIRGVAASSDTKAYNITMLQGPKDGICMIWGNVTDNAMTRDADKSKYDGTLVNDNVRANAATYDGKTGPKFQKPGYLSLALDGQSFKAGDVVEAFVTQINGADKLRIFNANEALDANVIAEGDIALGVSRVALPVDAATIYLRRGDNEAGESYKDWNPCVAYVAVYRISNPILNKVTVAGVEGAPVANVVTIEVPASTADAALEAIAFDWISNDDAWTADHAPVVANAWAFGVENTVTFTDKDGDESVYTVTISKAAASSDATLSALTVNGQAIALVDGVYEYSFELPYGTTVAPTVVATANHVAATATVDPCTVSGATITVVPESGAGDQQIYTLTFTISAWKEVVIWDGSYMTELATSPGDLGMAWEVNGFGSISSYSTTTYGEKAYTKYLPSGGTAPGRYMTLTVPAGYVAKFYVVMASHSTGNERGMFIGSNLVKDPDATSVLQLSNNDRDNAVAGMSEIVGAGTYYINPNASIDFQEIRAYVRPGYARTEMLGNGVFGTVCVPNNVAVEDIHGVTVCELAGREPQYGKIVFDEIVGGQMDAGKPYVFIARGDRMVLFYGETHVDEPDNSGAMQGTFEYTELTDLNDVYYFANRALWGCADLTVLKVPANRAYVLLSHVDYLPSQNANPAPGRLRMIMDVHGEEVPAVTTGMDALNASEAPVKVMIDGKLFILRGEQMFDATGRLVK